MAVFGQSDLIESVPAARQTVRQLVVGQVETIDILQDQQTFGIDNYDWRESETAVLFLRHNPQEAGGKQKHERQPTVICDTPDLNTDTCSLFINGRIGLKSVTGTTNKSKINFQDIFEWAVKTTWIT